jgi:nucleotidyltransferase-like protein
MTSNQKDKIISEFLESIGPWRDFVVIGGGFALFIYKLYLSDPKLKNPPVGTRDIDSLIPRKIPEISKKNIQSYLREAGFKHVFKDLDDPATEVYVKDIAGAEVEIEFLTDDSVRNNKDKNVVIAGVVAQPLSYLTLSLEKTLKFQTYSKVSGNMVTLGAWIFHKGLTFTKRKSSLKTLKDLYGIWYVASQLGEFSDHALDEFKDLAKQHPKWFKTFQKNLRGWLENFTPNDWTKLEAQDPLVGFANSISNKSHELLFEA